MTNVTRLRHPMRETGEEKLLLEVADTNCLIEEAIENNAVTPRGAQELLLLLEESMHQVIAVALSGFKRQLVLEGDDDE